MKKKVNILLIAAVCALWGTVIYRSVNNYFFPHEVENYKTSAYTGKTTTFIPERDTFILQPIKHNPFGNNILQKPTSSPIPKSSPHLKSKKKSGNSFEPIVMPTPWPIVEYYGYIKSGGNKELVLLKINNNIMRMHLDEIKNDIRIKKIYRDSIQIAFKKEERVFKKLPKNVRIHN